MLEKTDYELLHGDSDDFTELYNKYSSGIKSFLYLYKLIRNSSDVDDILQFVWIRAHNKCDKYNPQWAFSTWLSQLALHVTLNFYRDQDLEILTSMVSSSHLENLVDHREVKDSLVVKEIQREVRKIVSRLPENSREAIEAIYLDHTHSPRSSEHFIGYKKGRRLLKESLRVLNNELRTA